MLQLLLSYVVPIVLIGYFLLKLRFNYWKGRNVVSTSPNTFLGDLIDVGRKYHIAEKSQVLYNKFKANGFGGFYTSITPVLMVTDIELLKHILVKDFNSFTDRGFYFNEKDDPLSVNLLSLEGERWKRRRNLLTPVFTSGKLKNMFSIVIDKSEELIKVCCNGNQPLEAKRLSQNFTMKAVGSCVFGIDVQTGTSHIEKLQDLVFGRPSIFGMIRLLLMSTFPKFSRFMRFRFTEKFVEEFVVDMVTQNTKYREETGFRRGDLLDLLMDIKNEQKLGETDNFDFMSLAAESFLFFMGGFDTSASAMSWALFELARNKPAQDRLRAEIQQSKASNNGKLTYEGLLEMEYLNQVFNESLRMYPPFSIHTRQATTDYKMPGTDVIIEKGTIIWIPAYAIQMDPKYYQNPEEFNPDNFSKESMRDRDPYTLLPFSKGPRDCVGVRFANLQTKIGIASIIGNFKVSLNKKTKLPITFDLQQSVSQQALGGLWLDFEKL